MKAAPRRLPTEATAAQTVDFPADMKAFVAHHLAVAIVASIRAELEVDGRVPGGNRPYAQPSAGIPDKRDARAV